MAGLNYAYRYNFLSVVEPGTGGPQLRLATSGGVAANPYFFQGRMVQPRLTADLLLLISEVSRQRFYSPQMRLAATVVSAGPVVTSGGERLRFEAFSVCCGVYARLDMKPESIDGQWVGRGTTNAPPEKLMFATGLEPVPVKERALVPAIDIVPPLQVDVSKPSIATEPPLEYTLMFVLDDTVTKGATAKFTA